MSAKSISREALHRLRHERLDGGLRRVRRGLSERIGRELLEAAPSLRLVSFPNRLGGRRGLWSSIYAIEKVLLALGMRAEQFDPFSPFDLLLDWQDLTISPVDSLDYISEAVSYASPHQQVSREKIINQGCRDISKPRVASEHLSAAGYPLDVDPSAYAHPMVRKSAGNAAHDGEILHGPLPESEVLPGHVYNVLVDNVHDGLAVDFRIIYMRGVLDFFYEKSRPVDRRFSNRNASVAIRETRSEFSEEERGMIAAFCQGLGADYGECDVLRDRATGRLYMVDFAKTPAGPPNGLKESDALQAVVLLAEAFTTRILAPLLR